MLKHFLAGLVLISFVEFIAIDIFSNRPAPTIYKEYSLASVFINTQAKIENKTSKDSDKTSETKRKLSNSALPFNKEEINFISKIQNPPNCTTLSFPLGNSTNISSSVGLIAWNGVPNINGYRITINGSESDVNDVSNQMITGISYTFNNSFTIGETVSVTIVPYNDDGNAVGCAAETFTIIDGTEEPPTCTSLNSPINGASNVFVNTEFFWDEAPRASGYLIAIQTEAGEFILPETDLGILTSFRLPDALPYATSILVGVTPYDSNGAPIACVFSLFRTQANPATVLPDCTALNLPLSGATNVPVNTTIRWNAVGDIDGYILSIGTTDGGTDIVDNIDVGLTTAYELLENLPFDQEIFVGIVPYKGTLQAVNCTTQSFSTLGEEQQEEDETLYGFSPNGDNNNDFWEIKGIELVPDNTVSIYNRWGDMVFQVQGYNNAAKVFNGMANKKTNIGANELPSGTYFFNIAVSGTHNLKKLQGYVVLRR